MLQVYVALAQLVYLKQATSAFSREVIWDVVYSDP